MRWFISTNSWSFQVGVVHISAQRSTFAAGSTAQRAPTTQSRLSQTVWRIRGIASSTVLESIRMRVVAYWMASRRSPTLRLRSALSSDPDVSPISATKRTTLATTAMARPSSASKSPARWPSRRSQPRKTGMKTAAGRRRRARTPPAWALAMTDMNPWSGRAQTMPSPRARKAIAVGSAMGM
jgi:hypothetical protein